MCTYYAPIIVHPSFFIPIVDCSIGNLLTLPAHHIAFVSSFAGQSHANASRNETPFDRQTARPSFGLTLVTSDTIVIIRPHGRTSCRCVFVPRYTLQLSFDGLQGRRRHQDGAVNAHKKQKHPILAGIEESRKVNS